MSSVRGLLAACHPGPSAVVTAFAAAYAALVVGLGARTTLVLTLAVLLGQLSIGWSNDRLDAARDTAAGRTDKPIPAGEVSPRTVAVAAAVALLGCVVTSLALGPLPGLVHLVAVASGWVYNLALKFTPLSPLPFAVSFALLPAVATTAAAEPARPDADIVVAAGALGAAAHFANTVGDVEADAATGVRGLPQRLGPARSMIVMAVLVLLAALALLVGPSRPGPVGTVLLAVAAVIAVTGVAVRGRAAFRLTLVAVACVVGGLLASG
jgi:4-hydroxybenzoate polyprenyltransferase